MAKKIQLALLFLFIFFNACANGQNQNNQNTNAEAMIIDKDSIRVENLVSFSRIHSADAETRIDFTLKVTNLGGKPIPDLVVSNRMKQVHFFINEKEVYLYHLSNGREVIDDNKKIAAGQLQTFTDGWSINTNNLQIYGYLFTVQWTYYDIKSPLLKVCLHPQSVIEVHPQKIQPIDSTLLKIPVNYSWIKMAGELLNFLNNWDKYETDAFYHPDKYPNYVVSGETNAGVPTWTDSLAKVGVPVVWDTDRLMFVIKNKK